MSGDLKQILSPFTERKNEKRGIRRKKNICGKKEDKFNWKRQGIIFQSRGMVIRIFDDKGAFYDGKESYDSKNDDEKYAENVEAVVCRCSSK